MGDNLPRGFGAGGGAPQQQPRFYPGSLAPQIHVQGGPGSVEAERVDGLHLIFDAFMLAENKNVAPGTAAATIGAGQVQVMNPDPLLAAMVAPATAATAPAVTASRAAITTVNTVQPLPSPRTTTTTAMMMTSAPSSLPPSSNPTSSPVMPIPPGMIQTGSGGAPMTMLPSPSAIQGIPFQQPQQLQLQPQLQQPLQLQQQQQQHAMLMAGEIASITRFSPAHEPILASVLSEFAVYFEASLAQQTTKTELGPILSVPGFFAKLVALAKEPGHVEHVYVAILRMFLVIIRAGQVSFATCLDLLGALLSILLFVLDKTPCIVALNELPLEDSIGEKMTAKEAELIFSNGLTTSSSTAASTAEEERWKRLRQAILLEDEYEQQEPLPFLHEMLLHMCTSLHPTVRTFALFVMEHLCSVLFIVHNAKWTEQQTRMLFKKCARLLVRADEVLVIRPSQSQAEQDPFLQSLIKLVYGLLVRGKLFAFALHQGSLYADLFRVAATYPLEHQKESVLFSVLFEEFARTSDFRMDKRIRVMRVYLETTKEETRVLSATSLAASTLPEPRWMLRYLCEMIAMAKSETEEESLTELFVNDAVWDILIQPHCPVKSRYTLFFWCFALRRKLTANAAVPSMALNRFLDKLKVFSGLDEQDASSDIVELSALILNDGAFDWGSHPYPTPMHQLIHALFNSQQPDVVNKLVGKLIQPEDGRLICALLKESRDRPQMLRIVVFRLVTENWLTRSDGRYAYKDGRRLQWHRQLVLDLFDMLELTEQTRKSKKPAAPEAQSATDQMGTVTVDFRPTIKAAIDLALKLLVHATNVLQSTAFLRTVPYCRTFKESLARDKTALAALQGGASAIEKWLVDKEDIVEYCFECERAVPVDGTGGVAPLFWLRMVSKDDSKTIEMLLSSSDSGLDDHQTRLRVLEEVVQTKKSKAIVALLDRGLVKALERTAMCLYQLSAPAPQTMGTCHMLLTKMCRVLLDWVDSVAEDVPSLEEKRRDVVRLALVCSRSFKRTGLVKRLDRRLERHFHVQSSSVLSTVESLLAVCAMTMLPRFTDGKRFKGVESLLPRKLFSFLVRPTSTTFALTQTSSVAGGSISSLKAAEQDTNDE